MKSLILTSREIEVLEKVAYQSKMDGWFTLVEVEAFKFVVLDKEEDEIIDPVEGIMLMDEGISFLDLNISDMEAMIYTNLISRLLFM